MCSLKILLALTLLAFSANEVSYAKGSHHVKGYTKKDGTYVAPHERTNPNSTKNDNWSTKGNYNPYTGKPGTKDPDPYYSSPKPNSDSYGSDYNKSE